MFLGTKVRDFGRLWKKKKKEKKDLFFLIDDFIEAKDLALLRHGRGNLCGMTRNPF